MKIKGAIDKDNNYIFPHNGIKKEKYTCPDCNEDIIFKKGEIVTPHFSHKKDSNCTYYSSSPSESEIHIYAKNKLAQWLEKKKKLKILVSCTSCNEQFVNKKIKYKDGDEVIIEYNSPCRKYVADVAIINNGKVRYVLEVTNTHKTIDEGAEARPEPWFDFNATDIINDMNFDKNKSKLSCIRNDCIHICEKCIPEKDIIEECKSKIKYCIENKYKFELLWNCILCGKLSINCRKNIYSHLNLSADGWCTYGYNIMYDYKYKNLNIDIAIFDNEQLLFFIIFNKNILEKYNENILEKYNENIEYYYFNPTKFIDQFTENQKNNKNEDYKLFYPICDKSNLNGIDHPNKKCNDCIEGSSKDKLIKYKNIKKNY